MQSTEIREEQPQLPLDHATVSGSVEFGNAADLDLVITLRDGSTHQTTIGPESIQIGMDERDFTLTDEEWNIDEIRRAPIRNLLMKGSEGFDGNEVMGSPNNENIVMTRSLEIILRSDPGFEYSLSGMGMGLKEEEGEINYYAPGYCNYTVDQIEEILGQPHMGTMYVTKKGAFESVENKEPVGAYTKERLALKVSNTNTLRQANTGLILPDIQGHGMYQDIVFNNGDQQNKLGWMVYKIPYHMSANEIEYVSFLMDDMYPYVDTEAGYDGQLIYETWAYKLMQGIRKMHNANLVHNQLHPGNKFMDVTSPDNNPGITDMETMQNVEDYKTDMRTGGLTSGDAAKMQDLYVHLWRDSLTLLSLQRMHENRPRLAKQITRIISWSMYGYHSTEKKPNIKIVQGIEHAIGPIIEHGVSQGELSMSRMSDLIFPLMGRFYRGTL